MKYAYKANSSIKVILEANEAEQYDQFCKKNGLKKGAFARKLILDHLRESTEINNSQFDISQLPPRDSNNHTHGTH